MVELGTKNLHPRTKAKEAKVGKTFHPFASKAHIIQGEGVGGGGLSVQRHAQTFPFAFLFACSMHTSENLNKMRG